MLSARRVPAKANRVTRRCRVTGSHTNGPAGEWHPGDANAASCGEAAEIFAEAEYARYPDDWSRQSFIDVTVEEDGVIIHFRVRIDYDPVFTAGVRLEIDER